MTGLRHGWGKFDDNGHADFVHGGVPVSDFDDELPRRSQRRKPMQSKRNRACRKSKTGEKCIPGLVKTNHMWYDVTTCARCGKHLEYRWKRD